VDIQFARNPSGRFEIVSGDVIRFADTSIWMVFINMAKTFEANNNSDVSSLAPVRLPT
jgi:hypothetical protein